MNITKQRARVKQEPKINHEAEAVKPLLHNDKGPEFVYPSNVEWPHFSRLVSAVISAVHLSVLTPVSQEGLREFNDEYETAVDFYEEHQLINPFFIRYGSTLLVFDLANLPPLIAEIRRLVESGSVKPQPKQVVDYIRKSATPLNDLFDVPYNTRAFIVWINDRMFIFDSDYWLLNSRIDDKYMQSWKFFNTFKAWK